MKSGGEKSKKMNKGGAVKAHSVRSQKKSMKRQKSKMGVASGSGLSSRRRKGHKAAAGARSARPDTLRPVHNVPGARPANNQQEGSREKSPVDIQEFTGKGSPPDPGQQPLAPPPVLPTAISRKSTKKQKPKAAAKAQSLAKANPNKPPAKPPPAAAKPKKDAEKPPGALSPLQKTQAITVAPQPAKKTVSVSESVEDEGNDADENAAETRPSNLGMSTMSSVTVDRRNSGTGGKKGAPVEAKPAKGGGASTPSKKAKKKSSDQKAKVIFF